MKAPELGEALAAVFSLVVLALGWLMMLALAMYLVGCASRTVAPVHPATPVRAHAQPGADQAVPLLYRYYPAPVEKPGRKVWCAR